MGTGVGPRHAYAAAGDYLVTLVVNDGAVDSFPDVGTRSFALATITRVVNHAPDCSKARATPNFLWPPDHRLVPIVVSGVTDPDPGDTVTLSIDRVTQDEPTNGLGDGDTSPDAVLQGNTVLLRAERAEHGNGRVYKIRFTATDTRGGRCTGSVGVGVPPNMRPGTVALDDGQLYDATRP